MNKKIISRLAALFVLGLVCHLSATAQTTVLDLWPDGAPTDNGLRGTETADAEHATLVEHPTLSIYPAPHPNGTTILMCPGGGYHDVWYGHEGYMMADWLNAQGITLAVLKYRMPNFHHEVPLDDAQRAMVLLRQHADEWGAALIGVAGASAGGHLASTVATHYTDAVNRPDFQILFYPVITMEKGVTHDGTRHFLIGDNPSDELVKRYSNELQVRDDAPPAFIIASSDDGLVPVENSLRYYRALLDHHVSTTMHLYPYGEHGWGFRDSFAYKPLWTAELAQWLRELPRAVK